MRASVPERRLAAILAADVAGYSRMMGANEDGALERLKSFRRDLVDPSLTARRGRIVKSMGDGLLVEFPSAVDAVLAAITLQKAVAQRNIDLPPEEQLWYRVGINLGDILVENGDTFGDGVNIAARLESICEPGGICVSRAVRDQVRDKLQVQLEDLGEKSLKNIARPMRIYQLGPDRIASLPSPGKPQEKLGFGPLRTPLGAIACILILSLLAVTGGWWISSGTRSESVTAEKPPELGRNRAALAVLPFSSTGEDASHVAEGFTEDLITSLGRFRELSVISRAGTSAYKERAPSIEQIAKELNVGFLVEGSLRKTNQLLRVNVTLTESSTRKVLWSDRFEADPKDIFSVQDRIVQQIAGALAIQVSAQERANASARPASDIEAYDLMLRGRDLLSRVTRGSNAQARTMFERAIERAPDYSPAYVGLARVNYRAVSLGWSPHPGDALAEAERLARKAIELDHANASAYALLGSIAIYAGDFERGLRDLRRAIELNPSDADAYAGLLGGLLWSGEIDEAIVAGQTLRRFQPTLSPIESFHLALAYILAERPAEAIALLADDLDRNQATRYTHIALAVAYAEAGQKAKASDHAQFVRERVPAPFLEAFGSALRKPEHRQKLASGLKDAGL